MARLRGLIVLVWSILGTGIFGVVALGVCTLNHPKAAIAWICRNWARFVLFPAGAQLSIAGRDRLDPSQPYYFVGNHQSALDIPILMLATHGDLRFLAKDALFKLPVMGAAMRRCGFIPIDRSNARHTYQAMQSSLERIKDERVSFAVFPEGTRTFDGRLLPFRKGALKIGLLSGMPVVPFTIDGAWRVNDRSRFEINPGLIRIVFHDPIPVERLAKLNSTQLHDIVKKVIAHELGETVDPELATTPLSEAQSA